MSYVLHFQVVVEALFTQKPSTLVKVFIIVVSLVLGLMILAALIWCLWKVKICFSYFCHTDDDLYDNINRDVSVGL